MKRIAICGPVEGWPKKLKQHLEFYGDASVSVTTNLESIEPNIVIFSGITSLADLESRIKAAKRFTPNIVLLGRDEEAKRISERYDLRYLELDSLLRPHEVEEGLTADAHQKVFIRLSDFLTEENLL